MRNILRYIPNIPPTENVENKPFSYFREKYQLKEEKTVSHEYTGKLKREDFNVLQNVLNTPDEYWEFRTRPRELLALLREVKEGKRNLTKKEGYRMKTSEPIKYKIELNFSEEYLNAVENFLRDNPQSAWPQQKDFLNHARKLGEFLDVSYVYPCNGKGTITPDTKTLIFVEDTLRGEAFYEKKESYTDRPIGVASEEIKADRGIVHVQFDGLHKDTDWDNWIGNISLIPSLDLLVRKEFLREQDNGIMFTTYH